MADGIEARFPARVLGFPVRGMCMEDCLEVLVAWAGEEPVSGPRPVYTANPEMLWRARRDRRLREALDAAALLVPDGVGLVWASHLLGSPLPGRLPGIEILEHLLELGRCRPVRPYFLGARPDVIDRLKARLPDLYPGLVPGGFHHGYFDLDDPARVARIVQDIGRSGANTLVVGMGVPRDQHFIHANRSRLPGVGLAMGVGGSLDVIAGVARRAPPAMRRTGLEWLYRLATNPSRLGRGAVLPLFAGAVVIQAIRERILHRRRSRGEGDDGVDS